nr:regulator of microtubule dynamics protein 2 isoform X1 [Jaculus jaculus]
MPHSMNKELMLGIMVGTAGISLLVLWYHRARKPRAAYSLPRCLSLHKTFDSITLPDEVHNDEETGIIFQKRQLQILEKLNELLTNMEELKEEIRFLKETIPKLEEYIQDELGGKVMVHKISPQHRARKRKLATVQSSATSNSSEEAESEGGCCKEDQNFQSNNTEHHVTEDHTHHKGTFILHPKQDRATITLRPSSIYKSNTSFHSCLSGRRQSLLSKFRSNSTLSWRQQSRVNFDSQEELPTSDLKSSSDATRLRRRSSRKLSVVSYYRSATFFDFPSSNQDLFSVKETKAFTEKSNHSVTPKHISFSHPEPNSKGFETFDVKAVFPSQQNTIDKASYQQSTSSFYSLPKDISSSNQANTLASNIQDSHQLNRASKDSLHHHRLFSSYRKASSFTTAHPELIPDFYGEENIGASPQDEGNKSSATGVAEIRYITANTDTEEQSFPVSQALNTHIEELKLDVLLQKVDQLRLSHQSGKMRSFELLCDHKEKFKDEIEFMWRLVRAYGDMCEESTDTQEKKHYANIGKTLGERAVSRAPQNGYCHLWYAVLCGQVSEFEGLQNKINYGHCFKDHLDIAIQLLPEEPFLYYLKGRYCYTVSKLSWIEKKMAATLFGKIPSATVHEALYHFLKAEELKPGYSISNYMYLAKCHIDLEKTQDAWKFCNSALLLPVITKEDKDAQKEVKKIITSLKR